MKHVKRILEGDFEVQHQTCRQLMKICMHLSVNRRKKLGGDDSVLLFAWAFHFSLDRNNEG
jgi:hypothetical protein